MSLIKCPECNGQISDKAKSCPHCGFPFQQNTLADCISVINGIETDLSLVLKRINENSVLGAIGEFRKITGCGLAEAKNVCEQILRTGCVPEKLELKTANIKLNISKCPTCGSTNIETIGAGTRIASGIMFGLFSKTAKSQFMCENCGYKW